MPVTAGFEPEYLVQDPKVMREHFGMFQVTDSQLQRAKNLLANVEPFTAMEAMVTRGSDGGVFEAHEAISVEDALRMWTLWPAKAIGEGDHRGSIEVGKLADMTVLTDDVFALAPEKIHTITAAQTIVGGRVVFSRG